MFILGMSKPNRLFLIPVSLSYTLKWAWPPTTYFPKLYLESVMIFLTVLKTPSRKELLSGISWGNFAKLEKQQKEGICITTSINNISISIDQPFYIYYFHHFFQWLCFICNFMISFCNFLAISLDTANENRDVSKVKWCSLINVNSFSRI